jgi:hypothetical protein
MIGQSYQREIKRKAVDFYREMFSGLGLKIPPSGGILRQEL